MFAAFLLTGPVLGQGGPALKAEYQHSFRGGPEKSRDWVLMGPEPDACVKFEADGLRIALPAGHKGPRVDTGVVRGLAVQGDFEITLTYEGLKLPGPAESGPDATRFGLTVALETAEQNMATLSHAVMGKGPERFIAWMSRWDPVARKNAPKTKGVPAAATAGRLRLVRTADVLAYLTADDADGAFTPRADFPFGREPLKFVSIGGSTGGEKAALEVRVTDLVVRAEALPGVATAPQPVPESEVPGFIARKKAQRPASWPGWIWAVPGGLALAVSGWVYLRRRPSPAPSPPPPAPAPAERPVPVETPAAPPPAPAVVPCTCPGCNKTFRARAALAGKKVKCPGCGQVVTVPSDGTAGPS